MPIVVPSNSPYNGPVVPLSGLWNTKPREGDKYVNLDIVWLTNTAGKPAVQCNLGQSTTPLSQIVAASVDNSRCGSDVTLIFPDSGFQLVIPAYGGGTFPVFTNSTQFYAIALAATAVDETHIAVHNSMPPPVTLAQSDLQSIGAVGAVSIVNGTTGLIAAGVTGTIRSGFVQFSNVGGASGGSYAWQVQTGGTTLLFGVGVVGANAAIMETVPIPNVFLRFTGLNLVLSGVAGTVTGNVSPNIFYSVP